MEHLCVEYIRPVFGRDGLNGSSGVDQVRKQDNATQVQRVWAGSGKRDMRPCEHRAEPVDGFLGAQRVYNVQVQGPYVDSQLSQYLLFLVHVRTDNVHNEAPSLEVKRQRSDHGRSRRPSDDDHFAASAITGSGHPPFARVFSSFSPEQEASRAKKGYNACRQRSVLRHPVLEPKEVPIRQPMHKWRRWWWRLRVPWKPAAGYMSPHVACDRGKMGVSRIEYRPCEAAHVLRVAGKLAKPLATTAHVGPRPMMRPPCR